MPQYVSETGTVELELQGKIHIAAYSVRLGIVTVTYQGQTKRTPLGHATARAMAHVLLVEMLDGL